MIGNFKKFIRKKLETRKKEEEGREGGRKEEEAESAMLC